MVVIPLAKAQRHMARKVKFSMNWKKAKARVTGIHSRIANVRRVFLHKTTTLSKNHVRDAASGRCASLPAASANATKGCMTILIESPGKPR